MYGGKFEVHTDNNPLTYILTSAKLDATGQRWVASLANYDFKIFYQSGKQNVEVDALSRIEWVEQNSLLVRAALISNAKCYDPFLNLPPQLMLQTVVESSPGITDKQWREEQQNDEDIGPVLQLARDGKLQNYRLQGNESPGTKILLRYKGDLILKRGLLYRRVLLKNHTE